MIIIDINDSKFHVPTSWADLTFGRYLDLLQSKDDEIIILTGIPKPWFDDLMQHEREAILDCISFAFDEERLTSECLKFQLLGKTELLPAKDLLQEPFNNYLTAIELQKKRKSAHRFFIAECIANAYMGLSLLSDPVPAIFPEVKRLVQEFDTMQMMFPMYQTKPDPKALQAGAAEFDAFGSYGSLARLAEYDVVKLQTVKQLPTCECLQMLSLLSLQDKFKQQYATIGT